VNCKNSVSDSLVQLEPVKGRESSDNYDDDDSYTFKIEIGNCKRDDRCIMSPNYPDHYDPNDACYINIGDVWSGTLKIEDFNTENYYDTLTVMGMRYHGATYSHYSFPGVERGTKIVLTSDATETRSGWKLCREGGQRMER